MKRLKKEEKWKYEAGKKRFVQRVVQDNEFSVPEVYEYWTMSKTYIDRARAEISMFETIIDALKKEADATEDKEYHGFLLMETARYEEEIAKRKAMIKDLREFRKTMKKFKSVLDAYEKEVKKKAEEIQKKLDAKAKGE